MADTTTNNNNNAGKRGKPVGTVAAKYAPDTMRPYLTRVYGELPTAALDALSQSPNVRKDWCASPEFAQWDADKDAKVRAALAAEWRAKVGKMGADERNAIIRAIIETADARERKMIVETIG